MGLTQITTGGVDDNINIDSNTLKVDGTNNRVGIGTAAPNAPLTVLGGSASSPTIRIEGGSSGNDNARIDSKYNLVLACNGDGDQTNRKIQFRNDATDLVTIDSSGNVGINQTPTRELSLHSPNNNNSYIHFTNDDTGETSSDGALVGIDGNEDLQINNQESSKNIAFRTGGSERLRIDSSGRLLVGTTSSGIPGGDELTIATSGHTGMTIRAGTSSRSSIYMSDGTGGNSEYRGYIEYDHGSDYMRFGSAAAERVRIDSSGNVGIGVSSPRGLLHLHSSSAPRLDFTNATTGTGSGDGTTISVDSSTGALNIIQRESQPIQFYTSNTEGMRIDSSGNVGIGISSVTHKLHVEGSANNQNSEVRIVATQVASGYLGANANGLNIGTDVGGIVFKTGVTGGGSVGGSGTERVRIFNNGSISFDGRGVTSSSNAADVFYYKEGHIYVANRGEPCLFLNRNTSDGNILHFRQANIDEGTISVSGSTVSYNGAHLSRWSQLAGGAERTEILRGSVLSNLDEMCEWGTENNEQLNRMKVSDVEGDPNASGVFQAWDDDDDTYTNDFYCAMTGDFVIRIAQGTTVARGDLLMSAGDGTAKPQDDDIVRSKTIAKVTSTTVSTTYADGSYCVPCVLMAC
jgi:hypothetical protein